MPRSGSRLSLTGAAGRPREVGRVRRADDLLACENPARSRAKPCWSRDADVVLGRGSWRRPRELVTYRSCDSWSFISYGSSPGQPVQHRGHPPGEVLGPPDPSQAGRRVGLQQIGAAVRRTTRRRRRPSSVDVGEGEVHALGAGRRDDVHGVPGQEQPPPLHRLDHEAAHRGDALLQDRPLGERPAAAPSPSRARSSPRSARPATSRCPRRARPAGRAGRSRASACCRGRSRRSCWRRSSSSIAGGAAARIPNQAKGYARSYVGQHALGHRGAAHPVEPVAAGHEVAVQLLVPPVVS